MKCEVIRDLMPLYIDKLTSEETNEMIEEHLKDCGACQQFYEEMSVEMKTELKESIKPKEKEKLNYLKRIKKKTMLQAFAIFCTLGIAVGIFFATFGIGVSVEKNEVSIKEVETKEGNWELELELKNGEHFDLVVVQDAKKSRSKEEQDGKVIWEHVHTVKKVLHNPFDDMGDSMTIGGKVGDGSRTIFLFEDKELIYEEGKLITGK